MDKMLQHRVAVQEVLTEYHQLNIKAQSPTESALVFDEIRDHYLLLLMGWHKDERIKSVMIHIRLKDGKVWIEEDWTEDGVATDLLQKGIVKEEIVLAFHHPRVRPHTEFAIA